MRKLALVPLVWLTFSTPLAADDALQAEVDSRAEAIVPKVVEWRRDFHQHPELGNREFRTAERIAAHLKGLGLEVQTGVAHTGVVAVIEVEARTGGGAAFGRYHRPARRDPRAPGSKRRRQEHPRQDSLSGVPGRHGKHHCPR